MRYAKSLLALGSSILLLLCLSMVWGVLTNSPPQVPSAMAIWAPFAVATGMATPTPTVPLDFVAAREGYAYIGSGLRIIVLDVSDPTHPVPTGHSVALSGDARRGEVVGDHLYVTTSGATSFHVFDTSDPGSLREVGSLPVYAWNLYVAEDRAYITGGTFLRIVDVSNPAAPQILGIYDTEYHHLATFFVANDHAYVFYQRIRGCCSGVYIFDVSDPTTPTLVGNMETGPVEKPISTGTGRFDVVGNYVYVARSVYDVSQPLEPTKVASLGEYANDIEVVWPYAYAVGKGGLWVIDVSSPTEPTDVGMVGADWMGYDFALSGDYAYVNAREAGLRIIDISNPAAPTQVGSWGAPTWRVFVPLIVGAPK